MVRLYYCLSVVWFVLVYSCAYKLFAALDPEVWSDVRVAVQVGTLCLSWICFSLSHSTSRNFAIAGYLLLLLHVIGFALMVGRE